MARSRPGEPVPAERNDTVRQALADALAGTVQSARELSGLVGISEREVADHLEHLARSLPRNGRQLLVTPARCKRCGFELDAKKLRRPSRCPKCKSERVEPPQFSVESLAEKKRSRV